MFEVVFLIKVPNSTIANSKIKNFAQPVLRTRADVKFGVAYGSDTDKVKKIVFDTVSKIENVLKDPAPTIEFNSMGNFSLNFTAKMWVDTYGEVHSTKLEATDLIHKALIKNKIDIPFPTQTIHLEK